MTDIAVFNIVSNFLDGLKFSTKYAIENAGMPFTYIVITWNPSDNVMFYLDYYNIRHFDYQTNKTLNFIENLRNCFNEGFKKSFEFTDYACAINTDMMFYYDWLKFLWKYADINRIINCTQIERGHLPTLHTRADFGVPGENFRLDDFYVFCNSIFKDKIVTEEELKIRADATPHLLHKSVFEKLGGWNVTVDRKGGKPSDMDFFDRAKSLGIKNLKSMGSLVYHVGAVETSKRKGMMQ